MLHATEILIQEEAVLVVVLTPPHHWKKLQVISYKKIDHFYLNSLHKKEEILKNTHEEH